MKMFILSILVAFLYHLIKAQFKSIFFRYSNIFICNNFSFDFFLLLLTNRIINRT